MYVLKDGTDKASESIGINVPIFISDKKIDGGIEWLACRSRQSHSYPNQYIEDELKFVRNMQRKYPKSGVIELLARLLPEKAPKSKKKYTPKFYGCNVPDSTFRSI